MARHLLIRCKYEDSIDAAAEKLSRLLNVQMERRTTDIGESFLFSAMGIDGALYVHPIREHVVDRRLEGHNLVVDLVLYARLTGRMYSEIDALHEVALFIASFITKQLRWPSFVCTEEDIVMDELSIFDG